MPKTVLFTTTCNLLFIKAIQNDKNPVLNFFFKYGKFFSKMRNLRCLYFDHKPPITASSINSGCTSGGKLNTGAFELFIN